MQLENWNTIQVYTTRECKTIFKFWAASRIKVLRYSPFLSVIRFHPCQSCRTAPWSPPPWCWSCPPPYHTASTRPPGSQQEHPENEDQFVVLKLNLLFTLNSLKSTDRSPLLSRLSNIFSILSVDKSSVILLRKVTTSERHRDWSLSTSILLNSSRRSLNIYDFTSKD